MAPDQSRETPPLTEEEQEAIPKVRIVGSGRDRHGVIPPCEEVWLAAKAFYSERERALRDCLNRVGKEASDEADDTPNGRIFSAIANDVERTLRFTDPAPSTTEGGEERRFTACKARTRMLDAISGARQGRVTGNGSEGDLFGDDADTEARLRNGVPVIALTDFNDALDRAFPTTEGVGGEREARNVCPRCGTDEHAEGRNRNAYFGDGDVWCTRCGQKIRDWDSG